MSITKLKQGLKELQLDFNDQQIEQVERYLDILQKWNRAFNLTAIRDQQEMLTHHVLDSLAVARFFVPFHTILDVGTGAGLPGLMLAIAFPEKQFTLLDSNSKKTSFLKQAVRELGLTNVAIVTVRLETYIPQVLFDCVTSRAFASLTDFVRLTQNLLKKDGVLLAMKGPKVFEETEGLTDIEIKKINVPLLEEARFMVKLKITK